MTARLRVLVVDDSRVIRRMLVEALRADPRIEVVGEAGDPYEARDLIVYQNPDVMTLDIEMPRMNGVDFLRRLMPQRAVPTLVLTGNGARYAQEAREAGAADVLEKPTSHEATRTLFASLPDRLLALVGRPARALATERSPSDRVIAIGASTGGIEALAVVLPGFPADSPAVVVVQHLPAKFTPTMARRLDGLCSMRVKEAEDGERLDRGVVLIAPGDRHLEVLRGGSGYIVRLNDGEKVQGHRPSVSVLMHAVARAAGARAAGAVLTGMGRDGADGLLAMRKAGAFTVAQDEATSVVFGMPKAAAEIGAAERVVPLGDVAATLLQGLGAPARAGA